MPRSTTCPDPRFTLEHAAALEHLLEIASRDTGQSRRVADFLLAWWNAETMGGFDMTDLWGLDGAIRVSVVKIFVYLAQGTRYYPDSLGYEAEFTALVRAWRPQKLKDQQTTE